MNNKESIYKCFIYFHVFLHLLYFPKDKFRKIQAKFLMIILRYTEITKLLSNLIYFIIYVRDRVFLCSSGFLGPSYADQADLQFITILLSLSSKWSDCRFLLHAKIALTLLRRQKAAPKLTF